MRRGVRRLSAEPATRRPLRRLDGVDAFRQGSVKCEQGDGAEDLGPAFDPDYLGNV